MTVLLQAVLLAMVIEVGVAFILGFRSSLALCAVCLINLATNPLLNYLIAVGFFDGIVRKIGAGNVLLGVEAAVVAIEAILLSIVVVKPFWKSLAISLVMNAASFFAGFVVFG